jgi:hypothetical protein
VLEIHDTGRALPNPVVAALGRGDFVGACSLDPGARVRALAEGCARALALGARIHLDSTPGCGSQLLVLFAPSATPARTLRAAPASAPAQAQAQAQAR